VRIFPTTLPGFALFFVHPQHPSLDLGSRFLTVTGSAGSAFCSRIPNRAPNLARGGYASVLIARGNWLGVDKRPPCLVLEARRKIDGKIRVLRKRPFKGNFEQERFLSFFPPVGLPNFSIWPLNTIFFASFAETDAENRSAMGVTGMQAAAGFPARNEIPR